ncbi:hypothetical protein F66182_4865 [Fusarium sp. NRRL 66182]|nr:hypothetical protein F66182_4865 [Fusarium sp. NRRL 66182]
MIAGWFKNLRRITIDIQDLQRPKTETTLVNLNSDLENDKSVRPIIEGTSALLQVLLVTDRSRKCRTKEDAAEVEEALITLVQSRRCSALKAIYLQDECCGGFDIRKLYRIVSGYGIDLQTWNNADKLLHQMGFPKPQASTIFEEP